MTAHVTYATDFCHDLGPTVVYRRADHPAIHAWVQKLIEGLQFTGQIGLDFIEDERGQIAGIECNPRLTGGFYLLKDNPRAAAAYFDPKMEPIEAARDRSYAFRYLAVLHALSPHEELSRLSRVVPTRFLCTLDECASAGPIRCRGSWARFWPVSFFSVVAVKAKRSAKWSPSTSSGARNRHAANGMSARQRNSGTSLDGRLGCPS